MICEIYKYYGTRTLNSKAPQIESPHKRYVWFFSLERPGPFIAGGGLLIIATIDREYQWKKNRLRKLFKLPDATIAFYIHNGVQYLKHGILNYIGII